MVVARSRTGRSAATLGILIVTLALLSGCSGQTVSSSSPSVGSPAASASGSTSPSTSESPSASASAAASGSAAGAGQDLAIEAKEYAFDAPASIPAGPTHIVVKNVGKEDHQAQVAKLNDGTTFQDLTTSLQSGDIPGALSKLQLVGGPTGATPGSTVATSANLAPGQYVFLCFVESADGVPHVAKGMIGQLEVTGSASSAELPAGDGQLALQDFAFVGTDTLTAGQHTLTVTNKGPQVHEATVVKLNEGVTVDQLRQAFTAASPAPSGPPPATGAGGVAGISPGTTVSMDLDLQPGNYAFVCFVPDAATGKPHAALGMIGALTVQ
jgi:plastocyanin